MDNDDDMVREFVAEATTGLAKAERLLLSIEQDAANPETLDDLFRVMHSIKGNASFLGLSQVVALAHAGETAMGSVREARKMEGDRADLLLATVDRLQNRTAQRTA